MTACTGTLCTISSKSGTSVKTMEAERWKCDRRETSSSVRWRATLVAMRAARLSALRRGDSDGDDARFAMPFTVPRCFSSVAVELAPALEAHLLMRLRAGDGSSLPIAAAYTRIERSGASRGIMAGTTVAAAAAVISPVASSAADRPPELSSPWPAPLLSRRRAGLACGSWAPPPEGDARRPASG